MKASEKIKEIENKLKEDKGTTWEGRKTQERKKLV